MKYTEIEDNLKELEIFTLNDIRIINPNFREPTLTDWIEKGWITRIRRGWYANKSLKPYDQKYFFIGNKIYSPSYISLESALNYYGFIPEAVIQITSVTTKKTNSFKTIFGEYTYKTIKPDMYFGYEIIKFENKPISIASPEKTIIDYLYFHPEIINTKDFEELRFNKDMIKNNINSEKIEKYLTFLSNNSLKQRFNILIKYLNA